MSNDSSARFAGLELDITPPARPTASPSPAPFKPTSQSNRDTYNNVVGCSSIAEILAAVPELAGTVRKESLFTLAGDVAPSNYATVRTLQDGTRAVLGVVGERYTVVQDSEGLAIADTLLFNKVISSLNAGSYRAKTWVYGEADALQADIVPGDAVSARVLIGNSHDGSIPWAVGMPGNRVVCQNTFHHAMSNAASRLMKLRHSGNVVELIGQVKQAIEVAGAEFLQSVDKMRFLASKACSDETLKEYTGYVFSKWADTSDDEDSLESAGGRVYARVQHNFEAGAGAEYHRGTLWGAFNAVTEYVSHERGKQSGDARFADLQWGAGAGLAKRALQGALQMAGV